MNTINSLRNLLLMKFIESVVKTLGPAKFNFQDILSTKEYVEFGLQHEGYRSYSKGGNPVGYRNTNNDDWILDTKIKKERHKVLTRYAMYRIFDAWLGATIK